MTLTQSDLQTRARKRHRALLRKRRDPRFQSVMGRFVEDGLLETRIEGIVRRRKPVPLDDALWAGTVEPRIMELLPAVLVKRPKLLRLPKELPEDVAEVIVQAALSPAHACPSEIILEPQFDPEIRTPTP